MSTDYGSATINNVAAKGPSAGALLVQPPIAWDKLDANNPDQWNGQIGSKQGQSNTAGEMAVSNPSYPMTPGTVGRSKLNQPMIWCLCVAGCTAGTTGTITGSTFVAGAGTDTAASTIPANGYGWVLDI